MDMQVEVIVKLAPAAVSPGSSAHHAVQACATRIGISLAPLHPSTSDPELATYLVARIDPAALRGAIEQLGSCPGVEGAYAKPPGEPPLKGA